MSQDTSVQQRQGRADKLDPPVARITPSPALSFIVRILYVRNGSSHDDQLSSPPETGRSMSPLPPGALEPPRRGSAGTRSRTTAGRKPPRGTSGQRVKAPRDPHSPPLPAISKGRLRARGDRLVEAIGATPAHGCRQRAQAATRLLRGCSPTQRRGPTFATPTIVGSPCHCRHGTMNTMTTPTAVDDHEDARSQCWCCGTVEDPVGMIRLGNHPEVQLCVRCARWAAKQAWEIEDRARTGPLVIARDRARLLRRRVIEHGWQHNRLLGRPLRWLGKRLP